MFSNATDRKPDFLGRGRSWQSAFMLAAFLAYGCTSQTGGTVNDPLSGLPTLPSAIDLDLRENLPRYETVEATEEALHHPPFDRIRRGVLVVGVAGGDDVGCGAHDRRVYRRPVR